MSRVYVRVCGLVDASCLYQERGPRKRATRKTMVGSGPKHPHAGVPKSGDPCLYCTKPITGDWWVVEHPYGVHRGCKKAWDKLPAEQKARALQLIVKPRKVGPMGVEETVADHDDEAKH